MNFWKNRSSIQYFLRCCFYGFRLFFCWIFWLEDIEPSELKKMKYVLERVQNVKLIREEEGVSKTYTIDFTDKNIISSPYYYMQQNDVLYVEPDMIKKKSANIDPNRGLVFQIGGVALGVASILISILR
jgi:hypothetical protein